MTCTRWGALAVAAGLCLLAGGGSAPAWSQVMEHMDKLEPGQHADHAEHHHLHLPLGEEKCAPQFTYAQDALGPSSWGALCKLGKMQAPIDISASEKLPVDGLKVAYRPSVLDIINDCNQYRILLKFPDNYWLTVGKKPYNLTEIHFREPGENAVRGKRPRMSIQFVHFSPEGVFLVIEVPVVAGKENPVIQTLWEHIPAPGKENRVEGTAINPADLLPSDRGFYRFPGSLTTPDCNEVVNWYVMKSPIELSESQIQEYARHYHDVARPLQPLNGRPVVESR
jgi:carbonic anhydrase